MKKAANRHCIGAEAAPKRKLRNDGFRGRQRTDERAHLESVAGIHFSR
jgi:hypothetical protein